jgi:hypothetical protein
MPDVFLEIFAKNPPTILMGGGIVLLILSPIYPKFGGWGWWLILGGIALQVLWLFKDRL